MAKAETELTKKLKGAGFRLERTTGGGHKKWVHPQTGVSSTIPSSASTSGHSFENYRKSVARAIETSEAALKANAGKPTTMTKPAPKKCDERTGAQKKAVREVAAKVVKDMANRTDELREALHLVFSSRPELALELSTAVKEAKELCGLPAVSVSGADITLAGSVHQQLRATWAAAPTGYGRTRTGVEADKARKFAELRRSCINRMLHKGMAGDGTFPPYTEVIDTHRIIFGRPVGAQWIKDERDKIEAALAAKEAKADSKPKEAAPTAPTNPFVANLAPPEPPMPKAAPASKPAPEAKPAHPLAPRAADVVFLREAPDVEEFEDMRQMYELCRKRGLAVPGQVTGYFTRHYGQSAPPSGNGSKVLLVLKRQEVSEAGELTLDPGKFPPGATKIIIRPSKA